MGAKVREGFFRFVLLDFFSFLKKVSSLDTVHLLRCCDFEMSQKCCTGSSFYLRF